MPYFWLHYSSNLSCLHPAAQEKAIVLFWEIMNYDSLNWLTFCRQIRILTVSAHSKPHGDVNVASLCMIIYSMFMHIQFNIIHLMY